MQPTPEAEAFIARVDALPSGPGINLGDVLQPSLEEEEALRKLFATDRKNTRLSNPHVGLIDIFTAPASIKTTRARVVDGPEGLSAKYAMPVPETHRRKEGAPCMVPDLEEFKKNWAVFTEGSLSQLLDWNNVIAAGGSVLACLTPVDAVHKVSKRSIRKHYHSNAYPTSDVDLFLWGLNAKQAEAKIQTIYEAVRDSVPWDVTCIRTKHTVSIHSQYPYRSLQIVLRLYQSPAEVLAGFDIDAPCCAYDGQHVWANPRAIIAMMRQCNTVDMTRRSPSYEVRLAKYATRGFEVYVPTLRREEVDPTIFERSIARMTGLARLLVLEKLTDTDVRYTFLESRRTLRGRPNPLGRYNNNKRRLRGDLKADDVIGGLEMSDYDVVSLHIPYGPGWDARRIDKLVYQTDLGMNSTFNPKNKGRRIHRHPAFFGTMEECLEDCCEMCPEPIDDDERKLQEKEDEQYIRGRIKFIEENPGRQTISGSFNPIDDGEWSEQVYLKPTQQLFTAIAAQDRPTVQKLLSEKMDLNQRDHVGRSCLHVAILTKSADIACDLIEAGARITARLVDGRTPLHLAAQNDQPVIVKKLFEKNLLNVAEEEIKNPKPKDDEEKKGAEPKATDPERPSSEDDWSSHSDDDVEMIDADEAEDEGEGDQDDDHGEEGEGSDAGAGADEGEEIENEDENEGDDGDDDDDGESHEAPEDSPSPAPGDIPDDEDQPDVIEVNLVDWDFGFTALSYAVLFASVSVIEILLAQGADVKLPSKRHSYRSSMQFHPLTLTALRDDEDEACKVAECLIAAGATSTTADDNMWTIFHSVVCANKAKLLITILRCDEHAASMLDFPSVSWRDFVFPIATAIHKRNYAALAVMLSYDVKLFLEEADITRAQDAMPSSKRIHDGDIKNYLEMAYQPVEVALYNSDDIIQLLLTFGACINVGLKQSLEKYTDSSDRRTVLDWVEFAIYDIKRIIEKLEANPSFMDVEEATSSSPWKKFIRNFKKSRIDGTQSENSKKSREQMKERNIKSCKVKQEYLEEVLRLLKARGAKPWNDVHPDIESTATLKNDSSRDYEDESIISDSSYAFISSNYQRRLVPRHLIDAYDDLYDACFNGDDAKVQKFCLPEKADDGKERPLNISVRLIDDTQPRGKLGYTPLFAAVAGGKWTTVKLILAIAAAQYHPEDPKGKKFKVSNIKLEDDSDEGNGDDGSDTDSDITVEAQEVNFVDIASRSSSVRSSIKPTELLEVSFVYGKTEERSRNHNLLTKAIVDDDVNTFTRLANLYQSLSYPLDKEDTVLPTLIEEDRPEMLDLFIKRTGLGVDMEHAQKQSEDPVPRAVNDKNKVYLGLNVHGKKRADLATKNDPNAKSTGSGGNQPLVWRAAQKSANKVINYLISEKPLAAYRHYASAHTDERATWLTRTTDIEKLLPVWLGWTMTTLGESPLTAAIVGKKDNVETLKLLFEISPQQMATALTHRIKIVGYNLLMLAVRRGSDPKVMDFLLAKSLSPAENDTLRGWNIYHCLASGKENELFDYFLRKLPKDVNEALLVQQSKDTLATPLHLAITNNSREIVKLIIGFSTASLLYRDIDGSTTLHSAVRGHHPEIFRALAAVVEADALQMEDSVGNTILDIISTPELDERISNFSRMVGESPCQLEASNVADHDRYGYDKDNIERLEKELPYLHGVVDLILPQERKKRRTKVVWELNTFATMVDARMKKAKVALQSDPEYKEEQETKKTSTTDEVDIRKTLLAVQEAIASRPAKRQLIHVADVQRSVASDLKAAKRAKSDGQSWKKEDGLDEEKADKEERELEESMLGAYIDVGAGIAGDDSDDSDD